MALFKSSSIFATEAYHNRQLFLLYLMPNLLIAARREILAIKKTASQAAIHALISLLWREKVM
jgi:hypothetical protein